MLIGIALYRTGVITGDRPAAFYRRTATVGLAIGIPLATLGYLIFSGGSFDPSVALVGTVPNTLATIPMVLAYMSLIALWNRQNEGSLVRRVRAAGRMALTNYLAQTALGLIVLGGLFATEGLTRSSILFFVAAVWALQLWWSQAWLQRFRYGPVEWLWRCATYRRWFPLRSAPR
jgi:uncharacterized protein